MSGKPVILEVLELGAQGDGIALHEGRRIFAPMTLPGDIVKAEVEGERARVIETLSQPLPRPPAQCAHFGVCGGCALQHAPQDDYLDFKRRQVLSALSFQKIDASVDAVVSIPPRTRRRATFAASRSNGNIIIGFHGRRSHRITPISECAVITPGLQAILPKLKRIAAIAAPAKDALAMTVTDTATGVDVALAGVAKGLSADARINLAQSAVEIGLARLSINGETVMELAPPAVRADSAFLYPPPGGFLQAAEPSEAAMAARVREAVGASRRIVDLFAGSGTFSLRLAAMATLHAVEGEETALAALDRAARRTPGLNPVTTERRDLFRRPLMRDELKRFDAAVIDPPRAGAEAQARQLASSSVKRIAMVSCNAQTFARDLRILVDGGYRIQRISPIDQFLWSPHIEIVAALSR